MAKKMIKERVTINSGGKVNIRVASRLKKKA